MGKVKMIFAVGKDGEFCLDGGLPWGNNNVVGDLEHFANYTKNSVVIMGSGTWYSLPYKLAGRINIVLKPREAREITWLPMNGGHGHTQWPDGVFDCPLHEVIDQVKVGYPDKDIVIIGGRRVLLEASKLVDEAAITVVFGDMPEGCGKVNYSDILNNLVDRGIHQYSKTVFDQGFIRYPNGDRGCRIITYRKN